MTKWICNKKECELAPCKIEMDFKNVPKCCPAMIGFFSEWKKDEPVTDCNQLATNCSQLPDWCKVGEYVWCDRNGYGKIYSVREDRKSCAVYFRHGGGEYPLKAFLNFKQARLRQWLPAEAIGKVIMEAKCYYIISAADEYTALIGNTFIKMDELLNRFKQPDGLLCGVLEHIEDGEWKS